MKDIYFNYCILKEQREVDYDWDNDTSIVEDYYFSIEKGLAFDSEVIHMSPDIWKNNYEKDQHYMLGYQKIAKMLQERSISEEEAIAMAKALETN